MKNHYYYNVAIIARIFSEDMNKPSYNVEDFLDHTYSTVTYVY